MSDKKEKAVEPEVEKELEFKLPLNEVNLVLAALGELPAKNSLGLINKLKAICEKQLV